MVVKIELDGVDLWRLSQLKVVMEIELVRSSLWRLSWLEVG